MTNRSTASALLFAMGLVLSGCGEPAEDPSTDTAAGGTTPDEAPHAAGKQDGSLALPRSESPEDARVFFITPADGDTVESPVFIEFGIEGMTVKPAGTVHEHSGHHHLIINAELPRTDMPIPADDNYVHFGDGSTSTSIELPPGEHTLQLLLGDHLHIPHDPPVSSGKITITVAGEGE